MKSEYENNIERLFKRPVPWLDYKSKTPGIAISSRIRLARNIANLKFPISSGVNERFKVAEILQSAASKISLFDEMLAFNMGELSMLDRKFLLERHLVSRELCSGNPGSSLLVNSDEVFGMMINEEDHIRFQMLLPGMSIKEIWSVLSDKESELSDELPFSFSKKYGYLTSCPTNIGTGIRASVMLSLPCLALSSHIEKIIYAASKLGMTIRGMLGEGSEATGYIFQISNQSTLGESEEEILDRIEIVIARIIEHELDARALMIQDRKYFLSDFIGRNYAILKYSYTLTEKEAINALSAVRLGLELNMFKTLDAAKINTLLMLSQDAHLQKVAGKELRQPHLNIKRSEFIRKFLNS